MSDDLPIHDLWIRPIEQHTSNAVDIWHVLDFEDHVLRRLGSLHVLRVPAGGRTPFRVHDTSDEVWGLIEGQVECVWVDMRSGSPTHNRSHHESFSRPAGMLVPFGVAFGVQATSGPALLVRLMTNSESNAGPSRTLAWPNED
jgi:mannose-6-phosphate isomerase-like protein (cupin superfamily)